MDQNNNPTNNQPDWGTVPQASPQNPSQPISVQQGVPLTGLPDNSATNQQVYQQTPMNNLNEPLAPVAPTNLVDPNLAQQQGANYVGNQVIQQASIPLSPTQNMAATPIQPLQGNALNAQPQVVANAQAPGQQNVATYQGLPVAPQPVFAQQPVNNTAPITRLGASPSRKLSIIMAVVFSLLSLSMVGYSYRVLKIREQAASKVSAFETPSKKIKEETKKVGDEVVDRPDGTLDLDTIFDPYYGSYDQNIEAKIGQQINTSAGLSFMVKEYSPWVSKDKYTKPRSGYKFIRVDLLLGNRTAKRLDISSYGFGIQEGEDKSRTDASVYLGKEDRNSFTADEVYLNTYSDGLDSQKSMSGVIILEVKDTGPLKFVYDTNVYGQIPGEKDEDIPQSQQMNIKVAVEL